MFLVDVRVGCCLSIARVFLTRMMELGLCCRASKLTERMRKEFLEEDCLKNKEELAKRRDRTIPSRGTMYESQ